MSPQIRFDSNGAAEATTWVFEPHACYLSHCGEAISDAKEKGICIGLHVENRAIIVHFPNAESCDSAGKKFKVILAKGGAPEVTFKDVESFDLYHAERWGLVSINAPPMPERVMPERIDRIIEEDDASENEVEIDRIIEEESESEVEEDAMDVDAETTDIFALVQLVPQLVLIPSMCRALTMETQAENDFRATMITGGPLSPHLEQVLFSRGLQHVNVIQNTARSIAMNKPVPDQSYIFWLTSPPDFLTAYLKPNMHKARRVVWIVWKAQKLGLQLDCAIFMALFKQITVFTDNDVRLRQYKMAVKAWQNTFSWKELDKPMQDLIHSINEGKTDCYCKSCNRVLDPKAETFCSRQCASNFCVCGTKKDVRQVTDYETLGLLQNRVGNYAPLLELAEMLRFRAEAELCQSMSDVTTMHRALTDKRKAEKCCEALDGLMDDRWCKRCLNEFHHLNRLDRCVHMIASGKVTWGHCEAAAKRLGELKNIVTPKMDEKFCAACEAEAAERRFEHPLI